MHLGIPIASKAFLGKQGALACKGSAFTRKQYGVNPADGAARHDTNGIKKGKNGGGERDRTDDPLLAKQVLSQLSYTPKPNYL